jgi:hypothetical protein
MKIRKGPFEIKTLEEAYLSITYGYDEPDVLRGHSETIKKIYTLLNSLRFVPPEYKNKFNNCSLTSDDRMPENIVHIQNSAHPKGTQHYDRFNIGVEFV